MQTPPPTVKSKRDSTATITTDISRVWDDDSHVESSSPISIPDRGSDKVDECAVQEVSESHVLEEQIQAAWRRGLVEIAASQRSRRRPASQPQYRDILSDESLSGEDDHDIEESIEVKPARSRNTDVKEAIPQANEPERHLGREATLVKQSSTQPPVQKLKKAPAKKAKRKASQTQRKRTAAPPARPTRKRKTEPETEDEVRPTASKKPRKTAVEDLKCNEGVDSPTFADVEAQPLRRVTRGITRSRTAATKTLPATTEQAVKSPDEVKLIIVLRCTKLSEIKSKSPAQIPSSKPHTPHTAITESSDETVTITRSTETFDTSPSFQTTINQSLNDDQEQCAQPALAPVPASSQAASSFGSNTTHLIRPHDIPPLATVEEEGEDYDLDALPGKLVPAPWLRPVPPEVPTSVTPTIAEPVTEHDKSDDLPSVSFASTQPTLPLSQPYVPPGLVTEESEQDAESDVTTDDEMECDVPESRSELDVQREHLHRLARELFASRQSDLPKPAPAGRPEVWADGRQELCEALHYFRAYQSACYSTGDFARGFMFDKVAHPRDYMDEEVVISRAGGGLVKDKGSGEMKSGRDQAEDTKTVQALKNCMKHFNPVVLITGVDNPHAPSQPPHQYCVLDYFKPTNIWVEKSGKSKILRYRFEKLNTKKPSWWRPETEHTSIDLGSLDPPVAKACHSCKIESIQVYLNGWMCLQPSCPAFWRIYERPNAGSRSASHEPDEESLIYDPRFLKQKNPWPNDDSDYPLKSNNAEVSSYSLPGEDTSQAFWSGMVCPDCGRCNSRLSWLGWKCMNATCNFKRQPPHLTIPAASLRDPFWPLTDSYTLSRDTHASLIDVKVSFSHGYRINRYTIPGINGFITHMIANRTVTSEPGGPDAMFEELQQTDIDLRRRPMPNGQLKGESYCRHFTVNYGMPYKFIASTASHSFEHAARPITATRSRLNWAAKHLLTQETGKSMVEVSKQWAEKEFNEVLALGYFEAQKINYHDDGEFGLGPTIATLSLGAPGTMRIRMKARHYNGSSNAGVYDDAPPLPGCQKYDQRKEFQHSLEALKITDGKAYRARLKQIPRELGLKASGNARDVLRMELGHGDVVVMHGAELQRYYEHAVEHAGKLRFALTCRYIDPDSLKEGDRPGYVVGRDEGGYDGSKLCP